MVSPSGQGRFSKFCMVIVLFKSGVGHVVFGRLLVMTQEPECCHGIAVAISICTYYIFSSGNVVCRTVGAIVKVSNPNRRKSMSVNGNLQCVNFAWVCVVPGPKLMC